MVMCVNRVLAVLARLAAAALAVLMSYKLIADSGNQNKTSDKALWLKCIFQSERLDWNVYEIYIFIH